MKRLLLVLLLICSHAFGATWFVRSGASGNGTSWANAWANPRAINWSGLSAGDTVCIAGGTYSGGSGSIVTNKSGTSTAPITIKRAYALDSKCGSKTTGWSSAYDAQVVLVTGAAIVFRSSYITIDGSVSNGLKVSMVIRDCPGKTWNECFAVSSEGATSGITLRHLELSGPCNGDPTSPTCQSQGTDFTFDPRGLAIQSGDGSPQKNWLVQYNNVHGWCDGIYASNTNGLIIEHNTIADIMALPIAGNPHIGCSRRLAHHERF